MNHPTFAYKFQKKNTFLWCEKPKKNSTKIFTVLSAQYTTCIYMFVYLHSCIPSTYSFTFPLCFLKQSYHCTAIENRRVH